MDTQKRNRDLEIAEMLKVGHSYREIHAQLGASPGKVSILRQTLLTDNERKEIDRLVKDRRRATLQLTLAKKREKLKMMEKKIETLSPKSTAAQSQSQSQSQGNRRTDPNNSSSPSPVVIERDIYKKLYQELLEQVIVERSKNK